MASFLTFAGWCGAVLTALGAVRVARSAYWASFGRRQRCRTQLDQIRCGTSSDHVRAVLGVPVFRQAGSEESEVVEIYLTAYCWIAVRLDATQTVSEFGIAVTNPRLKYALGNIGPLPGRTGDRLQTVLPSGNSDRARPGPPPGSPMWWESANSQRMGYLERFLIPQRVNLHFAVGWTSACAALPMSAGDFGDVFHSAHDGIRRDVVAVNYVGVADDRDADPYLIDPVIVDRATTFPAMKCPDWRRRLKHSARIKLYNIRHRRS